MFSQEEKIYLVLLTTAVIFALILILFVVSMFRNFKRFKKLQREKLTAEIHAGEKERRKIASDIHDDIAPLLAAAKMQISSADAEEPSLQKAMHHIDDVIDQVRTISHTLMPVALLRKGLIPALQDHIDSLNTAGDIYVHFEADPISMRDDDVHVYRIVHEILHNSFKHAQASRIDIRITKNEGDLLIHIADNGVGMTANTAGLGLTNIDSRVELLNGRLQRTGAAGQGVHYTITIPYHEASENHSR